MKYFLAVDKGSFFKINDRFVSLNLSSIHDKLVMDNNLQSLCTFTMGFDNQVDLKEFLIKKGILAVDKKNYDLKIIYKRNYIHFLAIPYMNDKKYFDISYLSDVIVQNAYNPHFTRSFLNYFHNNTYLPEEYYELKRAFLEYVPQHILFDRVRGFLNCMCYSAKGGFQYRSCYEIAMFVSNYFRQPVNYPKKINSNLEVKSDSYVSLTEEQQFHLEELESRQEKIEIDGQMSLFKM